MSMDGASGYILWGTRIFSDSTPLNRKKRGEKKEEKEEVKGEIMEEVKKEIKEEVKGEVKEETKEEVENKGTKRKKEDGEENQKVKVSKPNTQES